MANMDKIFLWNRQVLFQGNDNRAFVPDHQPQVTSATYASHESDIPAAIDLHRRGAPSKDKHLFLIQAEEAGGVRRGLMYTWKEDGRVHVIERGVSQHPNEPAGIFEVVQSSGGYPWEQDFAAGHPGLFVTGTAGYGNLFRLDRIEPDPFARSVFTISPFRVVGAVPEVSFETLLDVTIRQEVEQHYRELQAAFSTASSRALVKHIASVVEGCIWDRLKSTGVAPQRNLASLLAHIKRDIDAKKATVVEARGYHSAETIRLAYQRTHPEAAARTGTRLEPEEAFGLLQDMKRVMHDLKMFKASAQPGA
jgi:hypothetical protein